MPSRDRPRPARRRRQVLARCPQCHGDQVFGDEGKGRWRCERCGALLYLGVNPVPVREAAS